MAAQKDISVECIAEEASSPPSFKWYLGEDLLNVSRKFLFVTDVLVKNKNTKF